MDGNLLEIHVFLNFVIKRRIDNHIFECPLMENVGVANANWSIASTRCYLVFIRIHQHMCAVV